MEIIKSPQRIQINKIKDIEVRKKELRKLMTESVKLKKLEQETKTRLLTKTMQSTKN